MCELVEALDGERNVADFSICYFELEYKCKLEKFMAKFWEKKLYGKILKHFSDQLPSKPKRSCNFNNKRTRSVNIS